MRKLIASIESHGDNKFHLKLTVLDAITMAAAAWDEVKPKTIENCFRHAGFVTSAESTTEPIKDTDALIQQQSQSRTMTHPNVRKLNNCSAN